MNIHYLKPRLNIVLLLMVMISCLGCPYESKFPLEGNKVKYNKNLIGSWHQGKSDLKIIRKDDYNFTYVFTDHDEKDGTTEESGTGYAVTNNGSTYLIAQGKNKNGKIFIIYKLLKIEPDNLIVVPLEEKNIPSAKKFISAHDFTGYVLKNNSTVFVNSDRWEFKKGTSSFANNKENNKDSNRTTSKNNVKTVILFKEDFETSGNNWYSNKDFKDSNYSYISSLDKISNHYYLLRNRKKSGTNDIITIPYYSIPDTYNSIEIGAKHFEGENKFGYGIKFGASDWDNCYSLNITGIGYYRVSKMEKGVYKSLVNWTQTTALKKDNSTNKLEVRVYNTYFDVYLNNQFIKRINNFSSFGKYAALEVYNDQAIHFDDLVIRKISSGF